jgi:NAD(P)-dependent dehydrogenase (short-subunit alcohol dehydrogenase family)
VRDLAGLQNLVDETRNQLGSIDILVNNAATNPVFGPVQNIDERAWDAIMNTNVKSCFFLSKMVREVMVAQGQGGAIVNVSSTGGLRASGGLGGYSVSKAAVIMLTQVCAKEWGPDGIRVNCIAPGLIKTEFSRALWENEAILKNSVQGGALKRIGDPDEMAGAVVYFASARRSCWMAGGSPESCPTCS